MAQIIDLQSIRQTRPRRATVSSGDAEILFFLGVRYEAMTDTSPFKPGHPTGNPGGGRKKRA